MSRGLLDALISILKMESFHYQSSFPQQEETSMNQKISSKPCATYSRDFSPWRSPQEHGVTPQEMLIVTT